MTLLVDKISSELREYIMHEIVPRYNAFDKAHRIDHAEKVIAESMQLSHHYEVNPEMVYVVAAYHDLGLCEGREMHHVVSGKILEADTILRRWFDEEQVKVMKEAVEDHRASNKLPPRTIYGRLVAEADRVIDPEVTLRRTIQYGLSNYPELSKEEQFLRFRAHLDQKYAQGGYLKCWILQSTNAEKLKQLRELIADKESLRLVFDKLYEEEC